MQATAFEASTKITTRKISWAILGLPGQLNQLSVNRFCVLNRNRQLRANIFLKITWVGCIILSCKNGSYRIRGQRILLYYATWGNVILAMLTTPLDKA